MSLDKPELTLERALPRVEVRPPMTDVSESSMFELVAGSGVEVGVTVSTEEDTDVGASEDVAEELSEAEEVEPSVAVALTLSEEIKVGVSAEDETTVSEDVAVALSVTVADTLSVGLEALAEDEKESGLEVIDEDTDVSVDVADTELVALAVAESVALADTESVKVAETDEEPSVAETDALELELITVELADTNVTSGVNRPSNPSPNPPVNKE
ncbi:hypothetical protein PHLCEN_2v1083 [Hermanssonia centrifuga]|uniref:Uncharacterized protein n=1 Tax=Hermanssonia centrifuga TaxID=98765 RepID=A0A2R6S424_9APHY|nr:hypothetical protein PHLCEN_2v1083 [Hermanssonia centrifuga]